MAELRRVLYGPALLLIILASPLGAQVPVEAGGKADLSLQGYYYAFGGRHQNTSGLAASFEHFLPKLGLLAGRIEDYAGQGRWRAGDNQLSLSGAVWRDHRWALVGGDFRVSTGPTDLGFGNLFYPELTLRGARISASRNNRDYYVYFGAHTLYAGPRIPFHTTTPQQVLGLGVRQQAWRRLELDIRLLRVGTDLERAGREDFLFPENRRAPVVHTGGLQARFAASERLRLFGELSTAFARTGAGEISLRRRQLSATLGATWETPKWSLRASFVRQGLFYLPLAGYFAGDRRGPSAELRHRPWRQFELAFSASRFSNNLERDPYTPTFKSTVFAQGLSAGLPGKISFSAYTSALRFDFRTGDAVTRTHNHLWSAGAGRAWGRQNLRFTFREISSQAAGHKSRQRSQEVEDVVRLGRLVGGAALRWDTALQTERRNSIHLRVNAQINLRRFSAFGQVEHGRDMLNETVFAANAVNSSLLGLAAPVAGGWRLQMEAYRSRLTTRANPENIFLLATRGIEFPALLNVFDQWSFFLRLTRSFRWGSTLPDQGLDRFTAERIPIAGIIEGFVIEAGRDRRLPAAGVAVALDGWRKTVTDREGRFRFEDVAEGVHKIGFVVDEMPADLEAGQLERVEVLVKSRKVSRVDLTVYRLGEICGKIEAPPETPLDRILLRLNPSGRYTTPEADGAFCFYNLREGDYVVNLDQSSLPPDVSILGEPSVPVTLDLRFPALRLQFRLERRAVEKPIREVLVHRAAEP